MSSFGGTVKLTGESEYRKALSEISSNLKVLNSEMKSVTTQYDKNDTSVKNLSSQNEILIKKIKEQGEKVSILKEALAKSAEETGENSEKTKKWQVELNNAQAELNKMNRNLEGNISTMKDAEKKTDDGSKSVKDFGDEAEKSAEKVLSLGDIIKANLTSEAIIGGVKALADGMATVGKAMINFGKEVVTSFGELEQNLGGSEAVFGKYAGKIQAIGEEAYKNLGISQSDYLATANKMGALFQGSGIEQQKSLELTEQAMQRAADMASVMGIDMSVAMESVAGAAKGNFTMMDNLGVAMNATTIEAYALEKGLDFAWSTATQAEKAEVAMQMFFEKTEQYAGNFERESTQTISGSIGLLKASVESFTAGLGNANADMTNLTQNVVDAFKSVVGNITPIIENVIGALPSVIDAVLTAVVDLLPSLLTSVTTLFSQLLGTIVSLLPELIPVALDAVMTIVKTLLDNLPMIVEAAIQIVVSLIQGLTECMPELIPVAAEAVVLMVETLIDNLDLVIDSALALIMALADGIIDALPMLIEKAPTIVEKWTEALIRNVPKILDAAIELIVKLGDGLVKATPKLVEKLPAIINQITTGFGRFWGEMGKVGENLVQGIWNGIQDAQGWILDKIKGFGSSVLDGIKSFFGIHSPSTVFKDEIGTNLALGVGEGFADTMEEVSADMQGAIPTEFDADISTSMKMASGNTQMSTYDMMVSAFKQALTEVKVVMDDREMGGFVTDVVERTVLA